MAKGVVKATLDLEIQGWDVEKTDVTKKEDSIKLSDGQGNLLTEGKYKLTDITTAEFVNKDNKTFKTIVGIANNKTIWLSQFTKRGIDPNSGKLFNTCKGKWAEELQAANAEGKAAKYILEHPEFEIVKRERRDVKDPFSGEIKSKWCYETK